MLPLVHYVITRDICKIGNLPSVAPIEPRVLKLRALSKVFVPTTPLEVSVGVAKQNIDQFKQFLIYFLLRESYVQHLFDLPLPNDLLIKVKASQLNDITTCTILITGDIYWQRRQPTKGHSGTGSCKAKVQQKPFLPAGVLIFSRQR